jgi:D-xylose transport system ATP-binding protein
VSVPAVALRGVSKRFGGVHAVEDAHLEARSGEIVGLVGHNGAGKSTLMKCLTGALAADAGEIRVAGAPARIRSPRDAARLGIAALYQDLALADNLNASANVFLGHEQLTRLGTLDERAMERETRALLARIEPSFEGWRLPVRMLSGGQRQAVAFARAMRLAARILVLDEPTAALGPRERASVAALIRRIAGEGAAIFLVSHDLDDVLGVADRVAVMHSGRIVAEHRADAISREELVGLIVGGATPA